MVHEPFVLAATQTYRSISITPHWAGADQLACFAAFPALAPGPPGAVLHRSWLGRFLAVRGTLFRPDVLHHGRLPSLFRPPRLQARARHAVRDGGRRSLGCAKGPALVGRQPSLAPSLQRHGARSPFTPTRILVEPRGLDSR